MSASLSRCALALAVVATNLLVACGTPPVADVVADAGDVTAPPADARLADVTYPQAAAWLRDRVAQGQPVVVKYFASWCGPCEAEAPVLLAAAADHPDVAVVGVDHQDARDAAEAWITEHGFDTIPTLYDVEGETARALGARGMPAVTFVDTAGRAVHTHTGPIDAALLDEWMTFLAGDGPRPGDRPDAPASDTPP